MFFIIDNTEKERANNFLNRISKKFMMLEQRERKDNLR